MRPCASDPDLWFSEDPAEIELAKERCQDCPMSQVTACRSVGWGSEFGVFGGLSATDRRALDPRRFDAAVRASDTVIVDLCRRHVEPPKPPIVDLDGLPVEVAEILRLPVKHTEKARKLRQLDMPSREVAKLLGMSDSAVRKAFSRAA